MRRFLTTTAIVLAIATVSHAADKPSIIYILLDDAGYGDLSCYGQKKFNTPNIDKLAEEGMKFTRHYSGSTVCAPTRCSLMTGLHTGHTYVRGNREVQPEGQAEMPRDIVTIPRLMKKAGYVTGAFGKWGLGAPGSASDPADHFNVFYGYNCQRQAHKYYPTHLWKNKKKVELDGKTYAHTQIFDEALEFVRNYEGRPFFLFLPVTIPHAAMQAPEEYQARFARKFPDSDDKIGKYAGTEVKNPIAAFPAMMTLMDDQIGQLMALLKEMHIDDNTLVLLSSDNGPHKEGGHDPDFWDSNGPFKGYKRDLYEGGIRAPLIARWPGKIKAGTRSRHLSAHWDMLPTFLEAAKATELIPKDIDGISLLPTLLGKVAEQKPHEYLYWEFYERGGRRAVRFGQWKAIQQNINKEGDEAKIELYHIATDIGEKKDVSEDHPRLVELTEKMFKDAHTPSQFWKFGPRTQKPKAKEKDNEKPAKEKDKRKDAA